MSKCICTTCENKECIAHKCKYDCYTEKEAECTIDGFTTQCSGYIDKNGKRGKYE